MEPTGSGSAESVVTSMEAPISRSTSMKPMRPGFNETPSIRTSESGRMSAATTRNAALDTSPGTAMWTA